MNGEGKFSDAFTDFFDNPAWDYVRNLAQEKGLAMRSQGWSGAAMLPHDELEYSGFRESIGDLVARFSLRNGDGHRNGDSRETRIQGKAAGAKS